MQIAVKVAVQPKINISLSLLKSNSFVEIIRKLNRIVYALTMPMSFEFRRAYGKT